eukprot:6378126-Prymnesium_polylepis.2
MNWRHQVLVERTHLVARLLPRQPLDRLHVAVRHGVVQRRLPVLVDVTERRAGAKQDVYDVLVALAGRASQQLAELAGRGGGRRKRALQRALVARGDERTELLNRHGRWQVVGGRRREIAGQSGSGQVLNGGHGDNDGFGCHGRRRRRLGFGAAHRVRYEHKLARHGIQDLITFPLVRVRGR